MADHRFQGSLFTSDFLTDSIARNADWNTIEAGALEFIEGRLAGDLHPLSDHPKPQ